MVLTSLSNDLAMLKYVRPLKTELPVANIKLTRQFTLEL